MGRILQPQRMVLPATPAGAAEYVLNYGWETAALRAQSPYLLNPNGSPIGPLPRMVGRPGMIFPVPTSDAEAIALGWPSVAAAVDGDIWTCDEAAGNLVGKVRGYQLAPQAGPLQNRSFQGLPYGASLWDKKAVEFYAGSRNRFEDATATDCNVTTQNFTLSLLVRTTSARIGSGTNFTNIAQKYGPHGWALTVYNLGLGGNVIDLYMEDSAAANATFLCAKDIWDGSFHLITVAVNRAGNVSYYIDGDATVNVACTIAGNIGSVVTGVSIGAPPYADHDPTAQVAWFLNIVGTAAARTGHDAMWSRLSSNNLGTPNTYARTNPLVVPISASRVACYGAGQLAVGYDAGLVDAAAGNALGTGIVVNDAISFLGLGTTNQPAWVGTNATNAAADGPSGMRDSARVADASAVAAGYVTTGSANLAGATNVPFQFAAWRQAVGGGGLNAVYRAYFTGDAGGPEELTWATDAGTVPATFARITGNCTPVGAGHTAVVVRLYPTDAVAASTGTVDFYLEGGVQNRNTDWLAHRRVGAGAAASTTTGTLQVTNVGNRRYNPLRGRIRLEVSGFQGVNGATFLTCGVPGAAGNLVVDYSAANLRLRIYDATPALVATVNCGAVNSAHHAFDILWDARTPIRGAAASGHMIVKEGATILGEGGAAWTPPTADVTPIYVGTDNAGANPARCLVAATEMRSDPGSVYN